VIEAWKIGVSLAMTSNASQVLGVLGRDLFGLGQRAKALEGQLNRVKVAAIGALGVIAGTAALAVMGKLVSYGDRLVEQQVKLAAAGVSQPDIDKITAGANRTTQTVRGSIWSENIGLIGDLRTILGNVDEAISVAPEMAKINTYLSNLTGQPAGEAGYEFARFLELRGALVNPRTQQIDPAQLQQQARFAEAVIAATNGRVTPHDLLMFQQQARAAGMSLSEQGMRGMVPVIQAMGGSRAGTALLSGQQQLLGGVQLYSNAVRHLEAIHLLDSRRVHMVRGGRYTLDTGALADTQLYRSDPRQWVNTVLIPGLKSAGYTTMDQQIQYIMASGLRSTVSGLWTELIRNAPAFAKDVGNIQQAQKVDQYQVQQDQSWKANVKDFEAAWTSLLEALGSPMVKPAIGVLQGLTTAILGMENWAAKNPGWVKMLDAVAAGLGVLSVAVGAIFVVLGAFALIPAGVTAGTLALIAAIPAAVAAAGTALYAFWPQITRWFGWLTTEFATAFDWITKTLTPWFDWVKNAFVGMFTFIFNHIPGFIRHWLGINGNASATTAAPGATPNGRAAAVPSGANTQTPVQLQGNVNLDSKKVGTFVANSMANQANAPKTGPTGVNLGISPAYPGWAAALGSGT
jgi:hypothetical protein